MQKPEFIREINGVRVLAAFIVLGAHYSTISGLTSGISLFFVITGFLSGAKIKRAIAAGEKLNFLPDLRSTLWRLLLPMHVVLLLVSIWIITSVDVLHRADWLKSVFAMSLGYGNLYENANATSYWDRTSIQSPTISLWAMSVLVQFALVLAIVRFTVSRIAPKMSDASRQIVLIVLGVVAGSLSVLDALSFNGSTTYHFSTFTWTWAFLLGLVLGGMKWRFGKSAFEKRAADFLFFAILALGVLPIFGIEPIGTWVRFAFGVLAIVCLLGPADGSAFFQKFLNARPMQFLGGITFGIYLVHWPLLIVFRYYTDANQDVLVPQEVQEQMSQSNNQLTWYYAIGLTILSVLVAWVIQRVVDLIVAKTGVIREPKRQITQISVLAIVPILVFSLQGTNIRGGEEIYQDLVPALQNANRDLPSYSRAECESGEVRVCEYGDENSEKTIAIVGTSTAGQWFEAITASADKYGWKVQVIVREGCTYAIESSARFCETWREAVATKLVVDNPALVIMETTHSNKESTREKASPLDQKIIKPLVAAGIPILGIRSTARFSFLVPDCIAANADFETICGIDASDFFLTPSEFAEQVNESQFIEIVDLTPVICPNGFCSPVDENIIRYVDNKHFTATYSATLADELEPFLVRALGN